MFLSELSHYSLQGLRVFAYVASMGSVAEAASALGLTQPALSLQIHNLEKILGFPLFERQGRKNVLTIRGQVLLRKVLPQLEQLERIFIDVKQEEHIKQPKLFLGSVEGIGEFWLGNRLNSFASQVGDVRFMVEIAESHELQERLLSGRLNIVVTTEKIEHPRIVSSVLLEETLLPVGSSENIEKLTRALSDLEKNPRFWEEIPWIGFEDSSNGDPWAPRWIEHIGFQVDRRFKYIHRANSYPVIKHLLKRGIGICVAPLHTCDDELRNKELVSYESPDHTPLSNKLYISFRENSLNKVHEDFIEWISQEAV